MNIQEKIAAWRLRFELDGKWPESVDQLLNHIAQFDSQQPFLTGEDEEMLSLVVSSAIQGEDIAVQFPAYYQKLLAHPDLRESFLVALEMMEESNVSQFASESMPDLSFLQEEVTKVAIEETGQGKWLVHWQQGTGRLQEILFPRSYPANLAVRRTDTFFEEPLTLIRSEVAVADWQFLTLLEAVQNPDEPEQLNPILTVAVLFPDDPGVELPTLTATLQWGEYQGVAAVDSLGSANFPPVTISQIVSHQEKVVLFDLSLALQSVGE
jgi:hypothetical protein